ncbi:MAG: dipeptidase [Thermomicrobiales bacterium]|nr:dipeptidase [Thermomicrobiales bacterium]
MTGWREYLAEHESAWFEEILELLRIPSISTDPERKADVAATAEWIAERMQRAGVPEVEIVRGPGHPLVTGRWIVPDKPRVLIYGHYDVQPVEPLDLWLSPPFEPTVRDGKIYARGSGDMKANLLNVIHAVEAFANTNGQPPVSLIFLFEGEEEIGSPNLPAYVEANKEALACDFVVSADSGVAGPDVPSLTVGLKGLAGCQIDIRTGERDMHSGMYGAMVPNANQVAAQLAASFHTADGTVAVDGFFDKVIPLTDDDEREIARASAEETPILEESGAFAYWGEPGYSPAERAYARPTLDINGIWGGFTGEGSKTVTPAEAHIKVTCRLVPDQDPHEIVRLLEAHVAKHIYPGVKYEVRANPGIAYPFRVQQDHPALKKAAQALEEIFGREPIYTRSGGSVPLTAVFQRVLGADTVSYAFTLAGSGPHAPNEWFRVEDLARGRVGNCRLFELLGE